jgi:aminopeptidase N
MHREGTAQLIQRADYTAPAFWIDTVDLTFDLDPTKTRVLNKMSLRRNPDVAAQPLRLDGDELNLARVLVNGQGTSFKMDGNQLVLENLPEGHEPFALEIFTTCLPAKNTKLMGLYVSNDSFFTQCEAEGFRRITYFLDRPDVMSHYSVTLRADKKAFPVLLSNGNLMDEGTLEDGRHFARWVDPHKKPCYLFALVAGQFVCREQRVKARSGKEHLLQVFVRSGDLDKTEHAMNSLMASIAWDEARFGLSLDLERFMIVATSDFNMGAMENKGLNIFNTKFVLANSATATDMDYANIESVVGHEYFHNWTGNRVTCRDWFQLSLKEGLTVFRDQEFSQDLAAEALKDNTTAAASAKAVKRIEDVRLLRTAQFPEDAGPMAHPVRPDSYVEINNFYTVTIYEKGSEVVRMMQTLTSREGFAKGMALYFERHDGQAVTCDDFAQSIADANPGSALATHLTQFKRWYAQAGTPRVQATGVYNAGSRSYVLTLSQSCSASPGQDHKEPFVIPVQMGLLGADGREVLASQLLVLTEATQSFEFTDLPLHAGEEPVPSLLRGFSAPVVMAHDVTPAELLTLLAHDTDPFNQWEAAQRLCLNAALTAVKADSEPTQVLDAALLQALRTVLRNPALDAAFKDLVLTLPAETYIAEQLDVVDPQRIHAVREAMRAQLARELHDDWAWAFAAHKDNGSFRPDPVSSGRRALSGMALAMLCLDARTTGDVVWPGRTLQSFKDAHNMTDRFNALSALVTAGHGLASDALQRFYNLFSREALVMDKWFALQAGSTDRGGNVLPLVRHLMLHPDFHIKNPNRARSLIFSFCSANPGAFHRSDAAGYVFWSERVLELDAINPQVAARLARALDRWSKLAEPYRTAAHEAIKRVAAKSDLSNDVREVVSRALSN